MLTTHLKSDGPETLGKTKARKEIMRKLRLDASAFKISADMYLSVATQLWAGLDTPRSLACALLLKYGEYAQLVSKTCLPQEYPYDGFIRQGFLRASFEDDYQAYSLLAKWPGFVHPDLDPVSACKAADESAEASCRLSNLRLRRAWAAPDQENSAYLHLISQMQADIARVLGGFDPERWQEACRFGPGKAQGQKGLVDYEKLVSQPSCTDDFLLVGVSLVSESTPWLEALSNKGSDPNSVPGGDEEEVKYLWDVAIEPGDRNIMVPKNAKTMRGIRPQPGLNVYAQLGIGQMIREQLLTAGLDLNDQTPNQSLAKLGSTPKSRLVTIDLKGASGHICRVLPDLLLLDECPRWLYAMNLCRTRTMLPHGSVENDDAYIPLQSYSAMGNGFTFELETLIFWAAVRAVRRAIKDTQQYRVYGDDIICSREVADLLIPFLDFLGFPINAKKTFLEGPFRESCGADFWHGTNIRPINFSISPEEIKEANSNGTSVLRWLQTCNAIRRLARRRNHGLGCDRRLLACWRTAILHLPRNLRDSLKSPWSDIRDDSLVTSDDDARSNPLMGRCGSLHCLISPHLSVRVQQKLPKSFLGAKATLLYRRSKVDRVTAQFDRSRSWLRRVLQAPFIERTAFQITVDEIMGCRCTDSPTSIVPDLRSVSLGAGWEVFQPVGEYTEWCSIE